MSKIEPLTAGASPGPADATGWCRVIEDFADLGAEQEAWDRVASECGSPVYMTYDWCRTWWSFYGSGRTLRLFLLYKGSRLRGVLPIYLDRVGFWRIGLTVARIVGANIPPKVFDPPISSEDLLELLGPMLEQLFEKDGVDLLSLGPVSEGWSGYSSLAGGATRMPPGVELLPPRPDGVCTVFDLPATFENYLDSLSGNERKNRRKYELRLLRKEYDVAVEVVRDLPSTLAEFEEFVPMHTGNWTMQGKAGHFGAWPEAAPYNRELIRAMAAHDRVRFVRIRANGEVVSSQYAFAFGRRYTWELPARRTGPTWDRFSLGPTGIVTMIGEAIAEGMTTLDGGIGQYEYKLRLGAREVPLSRIHLRSRRLISRARLLIFGALRFALRVCYHKVWYRRLSPLLPAWARRPQWLLWLRCDA